MAWARFSDTAGDHPVVMRVAEHPDAGTQHVNEVFGFVARCALWSAQHFTDYFIPYGQTMQIAGGRDKADELLPLALAAGYFSQARDEEGRPGFVLMDDPDGFIHIRTKEEIEWAKIRDRDRKNPALFVPVRLRDGDGCRYCRKIVSWGDQKSASGGTYDHLIPGVPATVDTYVVCCRQCNEALGDKEYEVRLEYLLDPPAEPYFTKRSVQMLRANRWVKDHHIEIPDPTPGQKYTLGDFMPGDTKISAFLRKVAQEKSQSAGGTQPPSQGDPARSGPLGPGSPVDPAEYAPERRPQGTATGTPVVHPGRSGDGDGPQGMAAGTPAVHPASPPARPAPPDAESIPLNPESIPPSRGVEQTRNPGRVGTGRDGPGLEGSGRDGTGREPRPVPAPSPAPSHPRPRRRRRR